MCCGRRSRRFASESAREKEVRDLVADQVEPSRIATPNDPQLPTDGENASRNVIAWLKLPAKMGSFVWQAEAADLVLLCRVPGATRITSNTRTFLTGPRLADNYWELDLLKFN